MKDFEELQAGLGAVWDLNRPGQTGEHVMIVLPSFGLGESVLCHYAARLPALEHRYLVPQTLLHRIPNCRMIFLSTDAPTEEVLQYYTGLVPEGLRPGVRGRFTPIAIPDHTHRSVADKLLERPQMLEVLRKALAGQPAYIEPWNVTDHEVEVARQLQVPINGTDPRLWPLGFKSAGRRIFREAGVPIPYGREDVKTIDDVVAAIADIRATRPHAPGVVIKHDNSASGDGNVVIRFAKLPDAGEAALRDRLAALPDWYVKDLAKGGVVEELIAGREFTSPSAQVDVSPHGHVHVLATHEQVLGGEDGQVYQGCRFPADPAYSAALARHAEAIGGALAKRGVLGRFAVDFAAVSDDRGDWQVFALEVNLRKGGTTHPYAALRNLAPGHYDPKAGVWYARGKQPRHYAATDNLVNPQWHGLPPATVIDALDEAGLAFDYSKGTGVVLHMLSCLAVDGRFGLTAIGESAAHALEIYEAVAPVVTRAAEATGHEPPASSSG